MGRLSTFAKNRILNLRFQLSYRIKQIASALLNEDNIKVKRTRIIYIFQSLLEIQILKNENINIKRSRANPYRRFSRNTSRQNR